MSITSRFYNLLLFRNFKNLKKINEFHKSIGSSNRFAEYVRKNIDGYNLNFTNYTYSPHNPLIGPDRAMRWICENYHSVFDYLDKNKINSLLEIGCGYGISTWILKDITKKKIIGLDINKEAIDGAKKLFKKDDEQIDYICSDYLEYFNNNPNAYFDTIITCYGPVKKDHIEVIMKHCNSFIFVGYRAKNLKSFLFWKHKNKGKHLSFSTTLITKKNIKGISIMYPKYYFTWHYFQCFIHAVSNKYFIPL